MTVNVSQHWEIVALEDGVPYPPIKPSDELGQCLDAIVTVCYCSGKLRNIGGDYAIVLLFQMHMLHGLFQILVEDVPYGDGGDS